MDTLKIILIFAAVIVWVASFFIRRKDYKKGAAMSWIATAMVVLALLINIFA